MDECDVMAGYTPALHMLRFTLGSIGGITVLFELYRMHMLPDILIMRVPGENPT